MSDRSLRLLLEDILEAIERIDLYTAGLSFMEFESNPMIKDAVARNFEIIGEAANNLPADVLSEDAYVQWPDIIGFRNILIHKYFGVDYNIVWNIIHSDLPLLKSTIIQLILDHQ